MSDLRSALGVVKPFCAAINTPQMCRPNCKLDCGKRHARVLATVEAFVEQLMKSDKTSPITCLLKGPPGSGKTTLAASIGINSSFPFAKIQVSAADMINLLEPSTKCALITKVFEDAYKSPGLSIIILDDIERLLEFTPIGPCFSDPILRTILGLLKTIPPKGSKLLVIGTSSITVEVPELMELVDAFSIHQTVPTLSPTDMKQVLEALDVFDSADIDNAVTALGEEITIKRLLMLVDMVAQGGGNGAHVYEGNQKIELDYFYNCLQRINT